MAKTVKPSITEGLTDLKVIKVAAGVKTMDRHYKALERAKVQAEKAELKAVEAVAKAEAMKVKQAELVAKAEVKAAAKRELELVKAAKVIAEVPVLEVRLAKYEAMIAKLKAELAEAKIAADLVEKARLAQILADAEADEAK